MTVPRTTCLPDTGSRLALPGLDGSVVLRNSGLLFSHAVPFHAWELLGQRLLRQGNSSTWWIADWLAYGETSFQSRYPAAVQHFSLSYQTLRNYAWVARRFDLSRRRDRLSFGHHAEVAALERHEQDFWLRKAEKFKWSRNKIRSQVRTSLRERQGHEAPSISRVADGGADARDAPAAWTSPAIDTKALSLALTRDQFAGFTAAASSLSLTLKEWSIQILDQAAQPSLT